MLRSKDGYAGESGHGRSKDDIWYERGHEIEMAEVDLAQQL